MMTLQKTLFRLLLLPLLCFALACGDDVPEAAEAPDGEMETMEPQPVEPLGTPAGSSVEKINLNTATEDDFKTIPDMNDRMVHEFMEYRPYTSIGQFRREIGKYVDADQVGAYEQYVFVPIDPNRSDAETLQQLPGVTASEAAELVAGRPYADRDAFLEKLGNFVNDAEWTMAEHYLAMP